MDKTKALQNLLKGKATKREIELLKQALASGEISIGGDVQRSIVIMGDGNSISLTPEALDLLKSENKIEEQVEGDPPYMGLRYFDTQDADLFYGREALTRELLARVQKESFLAIVGASGSGKSSVVRAGLIPAWTKENKRGAVHVITPTAHPLESLATSLTREAESVTATSTLMDDLKNDSRSLRLYMKKMLGETKVLLLVDQFEETFTLCKDADERKAFIENLLSLADDDSVARVVITLRADFYHYCAEYEGLRLMLDKHQKYIGAMTADELQQAITSPAEYNGWKFQSGLVDLILLDVGMEPGTLPLLSHALLETWKRRQGRTLTLQGYTDAGGVKKAIAQTAESIYDRLTPTEQTIARGIFLRLTRLDDSDDGRDTRKRVEMNDLLRLEFESSSSIILLINKLVNARLVVSTLNSGKVEIEVAHEALIRHWERLQTWLNEDRDNLRLRESIIEAARAWNEDSDNSDLLIHLGRRLDDGLKLAKINNLILTTGEKNYLKACNEKNEQLQKAKTDYEIEKKLRQLLDAFQEVTGASNNVGLDEMLDRILSELDRSLPCDTSAIWLLREGDLGLYAVHGIDGYLLQNTCKANPDVTYALTDALNSHSPVIRHPDDPLWPEGLVAGYEQNYSSIASPLRLGDRPLGVLTLSHHTSGRYGHEARAIAGTFANYAAVAIENARLFDSAQEQAYASAALLQAAQVVVSLNDLDEILGSIIRIMPILVGVKRAVYYHLNYEQNVLQALHEYGFSEVEENIMTEKSLPLADFPFVNWALKQNTLVTYPLKAEAKPKDWLEIQPELRDEAEALDSDRLLIAVPVSIKNNVFGVFLVEEDENADRFRTRRLEIITGIAQQAALAIQNDLLQKEIVVRERLETEIQLTREIQQTFNPTILPSNSKWQMKSCCHSTAQIANTFYDVFELPEERIGFLAVNMPDRGFSTVFFMKIIHTLVWSLVTEQKEPADILHQVNRLLPYVTEQNIFFTSFYGVLDANTGAFTYANAGHNPPVWVNRKDSLLAWLGNPASGSPIVQDVQIEQDIIYPNLGDSLIFFVGGATKIFNPSTSIYKEDILISILKSQDDSKDTALDVLENALLLIEEKKDVSRNFALIEVERVGQVTNSR